MSAIPKSKPSGDLYENMPQMLPLDQIKPHPDNPRLTPRREVIDTLAAQISSGGYDHAFAILVRPLNNHYQIVSGHHRVEAATKAGLKAIPAWTREMTDEEAYMQLVLSNTQSELMPLERGRHALKVIQKGSHKNGIAAYAKAVERNADTIKDEICAAEVSEKSGDIPRLQEYFWQLRRIHAAPEACWPVLCERLVKSQWTVTQTEQIVAEVRQIEAPQKLRHLWAKPDLELRMARKGSFGTDFERLLDAYERASRGIARLDFHTKEALAEFESMVKEQDARWNAPAIAACAESIIEKLQALKDKEEAEAKKNAQKLKGAVTLSNWNQFTETERKQALNLRTSSANFTEQKGESIEWARFSWNPVSGCDHNCPYCYARDLANRYYPQGFEPSIWPNRIAAPGNVKVPAEAKTDVGYKNVFTCSMADLFGQWVPWEWIVWVLNEVAANPQWNFLFLTKFPQRYAEFEFPDNAWIGTSIDLQARVKNAERAMAKAKAKVKWLSLEPLFEPLEIDFSQFQWVVLGGASKSSETPEWVPPKHWVIRLTEAAHRAGCAVYWKTNLDPIAYSERAEELGSFRLREYPGHIENNPNLPAVFKYLKVIK